MLPAAAIPNRLAIEGLDQQVDQGYLFPLDGARPVDRLMSCFHAAREMCQSALGGPLRRASVGADTPRPLPSASNAHRGRSRGLKGSDHSPLSIGRELCHTRYIRSNIAKGRMSSRLSRILSTDLFTPPARAGERVVFRHTADFVPGPFAERRTFAAPSEKRRTQVWELGKSLHCSIIGTCLSTGELRQLLVRLGVAGAETASDHDLHVQGVVLCGSREGGAKFVQKALDRRHRVAISQFAKAKDADALRLLWAEALKRGDIPGAYWALLTHPAATDALGKEVFGEVHMLSHLVGAANRADIRRLQQLEDDNSALLAKLERQQRQLRDGFTARDETIRRLNDLLVRRMAQSADASAPPADPAADGDALEDAMAEVGRRLANETGRRERLERRLAASSQVLVAAEQARRLAESERDALREELAAVEDRILGLQEPQEDAVADALDLSGLVVLYVGGRAHQSPRLKAVAEGIGAQFLHHDGGVEHSTTLLPGLVSRADLTVFPVDCVSHAAVASVKRLCRLTGKPYIPLRTSSLTALLSALTSVRQTTEPSIAGAQAPQHV
jgi:hypothetical protein